jgi:hypothetical protein
MSGNGLPYHLVRVGIEDNFSSGNESDIDESDSSFSSGISTDLEISIKLEEFGTQTEASFRDSAIGMTRPSSSQVKKIYFEHF